MRDYLDSIVNMLLVRSAEELIVGVFLALSLAMATANLHNLLRTRIKDNVMLLTVVGLFANGLAMILTAGYIGMKGENTRFGVNSNASSHRMSPYPRPEHQVPLGALVSLIFQKADTDRDGLLSAEETAAAGTLFVQEAEKSNGRKIDQADLSFLILNQLNTLDRQYRGPRPPRPPGGPSDLPRR